MANNLASNPLWFDTVGASSVWADKTVRKLQWVASGNDIADNDTLVFVVNGVTLTGNVERPTDAGFAYPLLWEIDFGPEGIHWTSFSLTTMGTGQLHIWLV